jgi:hypothetical protein
MSHIAHQKTQLELNHLSESTQQTQTIAATRVN